MKTFHLGDILTLLTVHALAPGGLPAVKKLADHMNGRVLFMYELARGLQDARAELARQFPELAAVRLPHLASPTDRADWLAAQVSRFGEQHEVQPIAAEYALTATSEIGV